MMWRIAKGVLRVKMHEFLEAGGWRSGTSSFAFRWQDGALRLIGYDRDAIIKNTGATEKVSVDYPARRMVTTTGTMAGDVEDRTETVTLPRKPLLTLDQVGDATDVRARRQLIHCLSQPMTGDHCRAELFAEERIASRSRPRAPKTAKSGRFTPIISARTDSTRASTSIAAASAT